MANPQFQRRHYRAVADTLASVRPSGDPNNVTQQESHQNIQWFATIDAFVKLFAADNPAFDREKFLTWCYTRKPKGAHV